MLTGGATGSTTGKCASEGDESYILQSMVHAQAGVQRPGIVHNMTMTIICAGASMNSEEIGVDENQ